MARLSDSEREKRAKALAATLAPSDPATGDPATLAPSDPATGDPATLAPSDPATGDPATLAPSDPATGDPATLAPSDPATGDSATLAPSDPATGDPATLAPSDPATLAPSDPATGDSDDSDPPEWAELTTMQRAGKRAARTRAENKANGGKATGTKSGNGKAESAPIGERSAGVLLELLIRLEHERIALSFLAYHPDGQIWTQGLAPGERGLPSLCWEATIAESGEELTGFDSCALSLLRAKAPAVAKALPLMERLDKLLESARSESEDSSFAFIAQTLANHFRADLIRLRSIDGSEKISKRGTIYPTALKAESAWIASQAT